MHSSRSLLSSSPLLLLLLLAAAVCLAAAAAAASVSAAAAPSVSSQYSRARFTQQRMQMERRYQATTGSMPRRRSAVRTASTTDHIVESSFAQIIDHFNSTSATFSQRYWSNDAFVTDWHSAPVFLHLEGEHVGDDWGVSDHTHHYFMAQQQHALLVSLEHRLYGKSQPTGDWSLDSLRLMNSQQALADAATFVDYITAKFKLTAANHWVVFGGSYAGALAAWMRIKYPHLVCAAVASSPAMQPVVNAHQYFELVSDALADPILGGSEQCASRTQAAFAAVDAMLSTAAGRLQASVLFHSCDNITLDVDAAQLANTLSFIFAMAVQYTDTSSYNVPYLCSAMLNPSFASPLDALISLNDAEMLRNNYPCFDNAYSHMIEYYQSMAGAADDQSRDRQWYYQRCVEMGWFQPCEGSKCILSHWVDLWSNVNVCTEAFGLPSDMQFYERKMHENRVTYGGLKPAGSNIVYVNGARDLWLPLTVHEDRPNNQTAIVIRGASHCYDMVAPKATDTVYVIEARKKIDALVAGFLANAATD